jgi:hypothetical protein
MHRLYKGTAKRYVRNKGDKRLAPFKPDPSLSFVAQLHVWKKQRDAMLAIRRDKAEARKRRENPGESGYMAGTALEKRERVNLEDTLGGYWRLSDAI